MEHNSLHPKWHSLLQPSENGSFKIPTQLSHRHIDVRLHIVAKNNFIQSRPTYTIEYACLESVFCVGSLHRIRSIDIFKYVNLI